MLYRSLIFDTETTGLPKNKQLAAFLEKGNWPDLVSICWKVFDESGVCLDTHSYIVKPEGWTIPQSATMIHGISQESAMNTGINLKTVMELFADDVSQASTIIAHNLAFDKQVIMNALFWRLNIRRIDWNPLADVCTGILSTDEVKMPFKGKQVFGKYKMPSLKELYMFTFRRDAPLGAHNAKRDVEVLEEIVRARWLHFIIPVTRPSPIPSYALGSSRGLQIYEDDCSTPCLFNNIDFENVD